VMFFHGDLLGRPVKGNGRASGGHLLQIKVGDQAAA
jgi:hypothetical protein